MIRTKKSLAELINSDEFILCVDARIDDRCKDICWTILGDRRYNLLWIVIANVATGEQFIHCIPSFTSPLANSPYGLDSKEAAKAHMHSEYMWNKYKDRLTQ